MKPIKNPLGSSNPARHTVGRGPKGTTCGMCDHRSDDHGKYGQRSKCGGKSGQDYVYKHWSSCAVYAGPSGTVEVVCPECQVPRLITLGTIKTSKSNGVCDTCSRRINDAAAKVERQEKKQRPSVPLPVYNGCSPVIYRPNRRGERARCKLGDMCPAFWDCLCYADSRNWPGFKEGKADAAMVRPSSDIPRREQILTEQPAQLPGGV